MPRALVASLPLLTPIGCPRGVHSARLSVCDSQEYTFAGQYAMPLRKRPPTAGFAGGALRWRHHALPVR